MQKTRPRAVGGRPTVSVVVPCYNYGRFLPECVRSVLDQQNVDVDLLIVDDASPDGSVAVARELADADPRVRVGEHRKNQGHIATYNEGLAAAEGEYVVLLSADDLLAPGSLARSAALLQAHPDVGLVYGFSPGFADRPPPARTAVRSWSIWPGDEWIAHICRRVSNPVATPEVMMRTALMRDLVGYDARVPHAADLLLWLRAAARGPIGRINGADQAFYRQHGANMHEERYAGVFTDLMERRRTFDILFDEDAPHLAGADHLREVAYRGLAREALVTVCQAYDLGRLDGEPLDKLVAFAEEVHPAIRRRPIWRSYERHVARAEAGRGPVIPRPVSAIVDDVLGRLRWRRWRRDGMMAGVRSL